ncbi:hypothetical protein SB861_29090 [Paraburkholderia sp. SIMBA_049]|uniref:hypothetical protein n=1 Tax=Paraburkholderia hospita TaxID=169430 RepID=UPI003A0DB3CD
MALHRQLRVSKPPVVVMAKFYSVMIERGLWTNQKDLAEGLRVSTAHVSRMLAVSRLPESILRLFVDKPLSSADVATVHTLIKEFGASVISERAKSVPRESTVSEAFAILTTGQRAKGEAVQVSIAKRQKYLRIDAADFASIAPRVKDIEKIVNAVLAAGSDEVSLAISLLTGKLI